MEPVVSPSIQVSHTLDEDDVMNGDGLFLNQSISGFTLAITHSSSFLTVNGSNVLKIEKPSNEAVSFSSGLSYPFSASTPSHVSFQFASTNPDTEDSNFRLMDTNVLLLSFRLEILLFFSEQGREDSSESTKNK